ncbi:MAG: ABC transporter ATP-binding protein [Pirellulaceae bacterium]
MSKTNIATRTLDSKNDSERSVSTDRVPLRVVQHHALRVVNLHKSYRKHNVAVPVLKGVNLEIEEGKFTAIVGQSGSGKSTLLHLLGTLDAPDSGEVWYDNNRIDNLPVRQQEQLRNRDFGMIFQFYHLLPELTTLENVLVPRMVECSAFNYWRNRKKFTERARELLNHVGLSHRLNHKPNQLSGGEMQRTAIARALISKPKLLLADEPTGNLDRQNGEIVLETLLGLCRTENLTIVMVTHAEEIAKLANHVIRLVDGKVAD